jgi:hypothetical protein
LPLLRNGTLKFKCKGEDVMGIERRDQAELGKMVEELKGEVHKRKQAEEEINCYDNAPMESSRHHRT